MSHLVDFVKYAQCRAILEALTRASNRQAQVVQNANDTDRDEEHAKYYELLDAVNQAQIACDRALLVIANAVVASDHPFADVASMLADAGFDTSMTYLLASAIFTELTAITQEAR
jgi:hypothetical protein